MNSNLTQNSEQMERERVSQTDGLTERQTETERVFRTDFPYKLISKLYVDKLALVDGTRRKINHVASRQRQNPTKKGWRS